MTMTEALRVLMVEDSETDAKLVLQALRSDGRVVEFERVEDPQAMRAALAKKWDVVICDWSMPKFTALGAVTLIKELGLDIPFIIASGTIGEELAVEAMRAGANDYVLKDKLARLLPAVEREIRDASERAARRGAERALRTQEARFRALIENSSDAISLINVDGKLVYLSPSVERILGYTPAELVGKPAVELIHPDDRANVASVMAGIRVPNAEPMNIQYRALHRDGSARWLVARATNMLSDPAVEAIVGNFRDVTDRKHALDDLLVSETRFKRLAESGIIGIAVADVLGHTFEANDAYLSMCGYSREDFVAGKMQWSALTPPEWRETDERAIAQLQSKGVAQAFEEELFHKDGHRVPVLLGVAMLDDTKCITFLADLTERKRAEQALHQTENQLRQAQKMEAIGRLAGGVAHDFNNVLSVILIYSECVSSALKPGDPMRDDIAEVHKAGLRAADLTRQLLMFSRQQVMEPKVLDLNEVLVSMDKMLQRILGEDIGLVSLPAGSLGRVRVDPSSVEQVIMNLVVNARDAMPTGGKLTIETANVTLDEAYARDHAGTKPGSHVMLAVSDTGTGMDKVTQARVFEPFFTTKEKGKGTGLGLSTVFGIVQQSGGSVWIYSEAGKGTTFKIYLPQTDLDVATAVSQTESTVRRGTRNNSFGGGRRSGSRCRSWHSPTPWVQGH